MIGDDIGLEALQRQVLRHMTLLHHMWQRSVLEDVQHCMCNSYVSQAATLLRNYNLGCADVEMHAHVNMGLPVVVSAFDCGTGNDFVS